MTAPDWPIARNMIGLLRVSILHRALPRIKFEPTGWKAGTGLPYWYARSPLSTHVYGLASTKTDACRDLLHSILRWS